MYQITFACQVLVPTSHTIFCQNLFTFFKSNEEGQIDRYDVPLYALRAENNYQSVLITFQLSVSVIYILWLNK